MVAKAILGGVVGGYNRGPRPGWLADPDVADYERLRQRERDLVAEIDRLKAGTEVPDVPGDVPGGPEDVAKQHTAVAIGTDLTPSIVQLDLELTGSDV